MFTGSLECVKMVPFRTFKTRTAWLSLSIRLTLTSHIRTIFHHIDPIETMIATICLNKAFTHMALTTLTTSLSLLWWINISLLLRFKIITSIIVILGRRWVSLMKILGLKVEEFQEKPRISHLRGVGETTDRRCWASMMLKLAAFLLRLRVYGKFTPSLIKCEDGLFECLLVFKSI